MKLLLTLTLSLLTIPLSFSSDTPGRADSGRAARFEKSEMVPGYKTKISFLVNPSCLVNMKLAVRKFESGEDLISVDTGKPKSVRIVNLYVEAPTNCTSDTNAVEHVYEVSADPKKMTHVYVTYENPIRVQNIESVQDNKTTNLQVYSNLIQYLGLKNGDVITSINGEEVKSLEHTLQILEKLKQKKNVDIVIRQNGLLKTMSFNL